MQFKKVLKYRSEKKVLNGNQLIFLAWLCLEIKFLIKQSNKQLAISVYYVRYNWKILLG